MATSDEILRLILRVENQAELDKLSEAIRNQTQLVLQESNAFGANSVQARAAAATLQQMEGRATQLNHQTRDLGRGVLQLGQTLDDAKQFSLGFNQGMRAIGNNIPGLVMALGGGPGLAGVLSILGSAIGVLAPKIEELITSLNPEKPKEFANELLRLKDTIKTLEDKPIKLKTDIADLDAARHKLKETQADLAAFEGLEKLRPEAQEQSGTAVRKALGAEGGGRVQEELRRQFQSELDADAELRRIREEQRRTRAEQAAAVRRAEAAGADPSGAAAFYRGKLQELAAAEGRRVTGLLGAEGSVNAKAGGLVRRAEAGDADAIEELARRLGKTMPHAAAAVRESTPGAVAEAEATKEMAKEDKERQKQQADRFWHEAGAEVDAWIAGEVKRTKEFWDDAGTELDAWLKGLDRASRAFWAGAEQEFDAWLKGEVEDAEFRHQAILRGIRDLQALERRRLLAPAAGGLGVPIISQRQQVEQMRALGLAPPAQDQAALAKAQAGRRAAAEAARKERQRKLNLRTKRGEKLPARVARPVPPPAGPPPPKFARPELLGAGGDIDKQQLDRQDRMVRLLTSIDQKAGGGSVF